MDPIIRSQRAKNSEITNSVPKTFLSLPQAAEIALRTRASPRLPFGIVSEHHSLMENPKVATWAQNLCGHHLQIALSAWFESDLQEVERTQESGYKDISVHAQELLDSLIKSEKDLKAD